MHVRHFSAEGEGNGHGCLGLTSNSDARTSSNSYAEPGADHAGPGVNDRRRQGAEGVMFAGPHEF